MKRNDKTFLELARRLEAGEMTRAEAAQMHGLKYNTLCQWLKRSGIATRVPQAPVAKQWSGRRPDIVQAEIQAVERVLRGETSALAAAKDDPRLGSRNIARKVREARLALGERVQFRTIYTGRE